ncbi:MAG: type Z 30S ribosomal protein S14 [Spirochaetia bacterium]|nr:type Z 30S ribosomal protein S14 [Spirochaetia bacterium]
MARKAMILKAQEKPKYMTRLVRRCAICGRARGYMRKFDMCRVCFRKYASEGKIPGVTKSSW